MFSLTCYRPLLWSHCGIGICDASLYEALMLARLVAAIVDSFRGCCRLLSGGTLTSVYCVNILWFI